MSSETSDAIVLKDQAGRYYVIPKEILEEALVPEGSQAMVEADVSDVEGFAANALNFSFAGNLSIPNAKVKSHYGYRAGGWPCDFPAGGWPCDTPQLGGQQSH